MARRSAVKAKTQAINQLRALLVTAPESIRATLWKVKPEQCVARCARLQSLGDTPLLKALTSTLRLLARRWISLAMELHQLDAALEELTKRAVRRLLARFGVGPQTAATLLVTAGDNPDRLRSEAALAALCGASPLEASSGKTTRHRLNRGGDRAANNALWTISMVRMRSDPRTRAYVTRRTAEGLSTKEIQRCLKRYIVRELYPLILADLADSIRESWHRSVNAPMESFFHTLKTELVMHCDYKTRDQARASLFDYMEVFYNRQRRHSTINYVAPLAFEESTSAWSDCPFFVGNIKSSPFDL
jgi:transposase